MGRLAKAFAIGCLASATVFGSTAEARPVRNGIVSYATLGFEGFYGEYCSGDNACEDEPEPNPVRLRTVRPGGRLRTLSCSSRSKPCADDSPSFSLDGRLLASRSADGLTIRRASGRIVRRVELNVHSFSWSPSGRSLAAVVPSRGTADGAGPVLYLVGRDGRRVQELLSLPGLETVAWSPNGRALVLTTRLSTSESAVFERGEIYTVGSDGSNLHRVASGLGYSGATWARRGMLLWTRRARHPHIGDIMTAAPSGERVRRLVRGGEGPIVSRSRARAAYSCFSGICRVDLSTGRRRLVSGRCDASGGYAWSPDGQWLACTTPYARVLKVGWRGRRAVAVDLDAYPGALDWGRRPSR